MTIIFGLVDPKLNPNWTKANMGSKLIFLHLYRCMFEFIFELQTNDSYKRSPQLETLNSILECYYDEKKYNKKFKDLPFTTYKKVSV